MSTDHESHFALSMLNSASVKIGGVWDVAVCRPFEDKYKYVWQGKDREGCNFLCTLVSSDDPSQYCQAQFKKTAANANKYQEALRAFKDGSRFEMSNVALVQDAKLQYVSSPLKIVVDLSKTKMDACVGAPASAVQPAPTATVASSVNIATDQCFDVTALIQKVGETRHHENNRSSFAVWIYDGSVDNDTQKTKVMPLTVYFDTIASTTCPSSAAQPVSDQSWRALVEEQLQGKKAVSFFCVSGAQDADGKLSFRTTKNAFLIKGVGTKAQKLNSNAALHNLQEEDTVAFELQTGKAAKDWSQQLGTETRCKLLATFARNTTGVPELDNADTIWQCNWVRITEPSEGQNIKSNDGKRLWLPVTLRDETGCIVLYITEQAVLKLANVVDVTAFEQLHSEKRLRFLFWASVKVWRRPSKASAAQPGADDRQNNEFDSFIVDAAEQDVTEAFSQRSTLLLPMLGDSVDNVLPTTLGMLRKSEHYALAVQYTAQEIPPELSKAASKAVPGVPLLRPCSRAVALVLSRKRSKVVHAGAGGHKLVTDDVVDFLEEASDAAQKKPASPRFALSRLSQTSSWIHRRGPRTKLR